jgi:hypothetical protein
MPVIETLTLAALLGGGVKAVLEQKGVDSALAITQAAYTFYKRVGGKPVNHDLQRAARRASLQATLITCNACLLELGVAPRRWERPERPRLQFQRSRDVRNLDALGKALRKEIRATFKASYLAPTRDTDAEVHRLLEEDGQAGNHQRPFAERLQQQVIDDLPTWQPDLPHRLEEMVREGWDAEREDGGREHQDWFSWMCACFVDQLKRDEKVRAVFDSRLLAKLAGEDVGLRLDELESTWAAWSDKVVDRFDRVEQELRHLSQELAEGIAGIEEDLETLRPLLAMLPDMAAQHEEVLSDIRQELSALRRRPGYERYAGREAAGQVERLVRAATAGVFVGRETSVATLNDFVEHHASGRLVMTARAGFGKTSLLANWLTERQGGGFVAYHFFSVGEQQTHSRALACRSLLRQLYDYYLLDDEQEPFPEHDQQVRDTITALIEDRKAPHGKLIILLDAMDEADEGFPASIFPSELPTGVYLVVSARAGMNDQPSYLRGWTDDAQLLHLDRLQLAAVVAWLESAGGGELASLASNEGVIREFDQKTQGFPLYVHYLIQEMVNASQQGGDATELLTRTPEGFTAYIQGHVDRLYEQTLPRQLLKLFALLSVAKGALRQHELQDLLTEMGEPEMGEPGFQQLRTRFEVNRWLQFIGKGRGTPWAFSQPLLAETFARCMQELAADASHRLQQWCARWPEHRSDYALRHYHEHLLDAIPEQHEGEDAGVSDELHDLYSLARDPALLRAQATRFPGEPDLTLRPVQAAIRAAAKTDDAGGMAEFVLLHLRRLMEMQAASSPLAALHVAGSVRAQELADSTEPEQRVLWYLLLAWALCDEGRVDAAAAMLDRLHSPPPPRLKDWLGELAASLLVRVLDTGAERVGGLAGLILEDPQRYAVFRRLLSAHASPEVVGQIAWGIGAPVRELALAELAEAQARRGNMDAARELLRSVDEALAPTPESRWLGVILAAVARARASVGEVDAARHAVMAIEDPDDQIQALLGVAGAQADRSDDAVVAIFEAARKAAQERLQSQELVAALVWYERRWSELEGGGADAPASPAQTVERAFQDDRDWIRGRLAEAKDQNAADAALQEAWLAAQDLRQRLQQAAFMCAIAEAQVALGRDPEASRMFQAAMAAASAIPEPPSSAAALGEVVAALSRAGQLAAARTSADRIANLSVRAATLLVVGQAELRAGNPEAATATLAGASAAAVGMKDDGQRADTLSAVGLAQAEAGLEEAAARSHRVAWDAARRLEAEARPAALMQVAVRRARAAPEEGPSMVRRLMAAAVEGFEDPKVRVDLLTMLARAVARAGLVELAVPVFETARDAARGIDALKWPQHQVLVALAQVEEASFEVAPAIARAVAAAEEAAARIELPIDRALALMALAGTCVRSGDAEQAAKIFAAAWTAALAVTDPVERAATVDALVDAWASGGEGQQSGSTWTVLRDMARGRQAVAPVDAERIVDARRRAAALSALAWRHAFEGRLDEAAATFAAARVAARLIEGRARRVAALVDIGQWQAWTGAPMDPAEVLQAAAVEASQAQGAALRTRLLWMVARAWVGAKAAAEAAEAFAAARAATADIDDAETQTVALLVIARTQVRAVPDGGGATLEAARQAAARIADPTRRRLLLEAAERVTRPVIEVDAAMLEHLRAGHFALARVRALATVALAEARAGQRAGALTTIDLAEREASFVEDQVCKPLVLLEIARAQARARENARAAANLTAAHQAADRIEDPAEQAAVLAAIAEVEAEAGDQQRARATLASAAATAATASPAARQVDALERVAERQAMIGDLSGALATCSALEDLDAGGSRRALRLQIAWTQADQDASKAARETIAAIIEPERRARRDEFEQSRAWRLAEIGRLRVEAGAFDDARVVADWLADEAPRTALLADIAEAERSAAQATDRGTRIRTDAVGDAVVGSLEEAASAGADVQHPRAERPDAPTAAEGVQLRKARAIAFEKAADHTSQWLKSDWSRSLLDDAGQFVREHDRDNFERLLVPCAHYPEAAYGICALLAQEYRWQTERVATAVRRFG